MVLPQGHRGNFRPVTPPQKFRAACYTIEGLNSFATILFFNYLYFFMRDRFEFGDRRNLLLAAWLGLTYTFAAWQAGRFAHRFGYFTALKIGFGLATGLRARGDSRRDGDQHRHVLHLAHTRGARQRK